MSGSGKRVTARYRWAVASRVIAALLGGYALTSAATVLLALFWPIPRAQAVMASTMVSFTIYAIIVLWAFHEASMKRVWAVMVIGTALLSGIAWLLGAGSPA